MEGRYINKLQLAESALKLRTLLEKYAMSFSAAGDVLRRHRALLDAAINGNIDQPMQKGFLPEEMWESGALFALKDLCETAASFSILLEGWPSLEAFDKKMREISLQAEQDEIELKKKKMENKHK